MEVSGTENETSGVFNFLWVCVSDLTTILHLGELWQRIGNAWDG